MPYPRKITKGEVVEDGSTPGNGFEVSARKLTMAPRESRDFPFANCSSLIFFRVLSVDAQVTRELPRRIASADWVASCMGKTCLPIPRGGELRSLLKISHFLRLRLALLEFDFKSRILTADAEAATDRFTLFAVALHALDAGRFGRTTVVGKTPACLRFVIGSAIPTMPGRFSKRFYGDSHILCLWLVS